MNNNLYTKLNELKQEELVWIIYLGIILLSFYSNSLERDYFINNNIDSKKKYQETLVIIFLILVIIYSTFVKSSFQSIKELTIFDSNKKKFLTNLSFLASILILISGLIYLYIALSDENIDVELAFN